MILLSDLVWLCCPMQTHDSPLLVKVVRRLALTRSDSGVVQPETVLVVGGLDRTLLQLNETQVRQVTVLVPLTDHLLPTLAVPHLEVDIGGDIELGVGSHISRRHCTEAGANVIDVVIHAGLTGAALDALDPVLAVLSELSDGGDGDGVHGELFSLVVDGVCDDGRDLVGPDDLGHVQHVVDVHTLVLPAEVGNHVTHLVLDGAVPTDGRALALVAVDHVITHLSSLLRGCATYEMYVKHN
jgi:hypothetical protein